MMNKIKVQIFGDKDVIQTQGCSSKGSGSGCGGGCTSCGKGCSGCGHSESVNQSKTLLDNCKEVFHYIENSDAGEQVDLKFYDINNTNILDYDDIRILVERGFEGPFTVIDGIVRYYGGISAQLIYRDIKELIGSNK